MPHKASGLYSEPDGIALVSLGIQQHLGAKGSDRFSVFLLQDRAFVPALCFA